MQIDTQKIKAELDELANPPEAVSSMKVHISVKTDKNFPSACRVSEYERKGRYGFDILFNPTKIRSQNTLDRHLDFCRQSVVS